VKGAEDPHNESGSVRDHIAGWIQAITYGHEVVNVSNERIARIAIVGLGLRYPDAATPHELWENVLAGRKACRQRQDDHPTALSALSAPSCRLALDTAAVALADAGLRDTRVLRRRTAGVAVDDNPVVAERILDHFGLANGHVLGGGSLLSVANAAEALAAGDLDVAIAGESRGMVVLMREADALARHQRIYTSITGWAGSSNDTDALTGAYARAGYDMATVSYFEGNGDDAQAELLTAPGRAADPTAPPAALGSVADDLGHPAGVAGLIKAALAVQHQVIPPAANHSEPARAALWPATLPVRAGVSGGGCHLALEEAPGRERRTGLGSWTTALVAGRQDADLLLVDAHSADELLDRLTCLAGLVAKLTIAELTDVAGTLAIQRRGGDFRAAVVAGDPASAADGLRRLADEVAAGRTTLLAPEAGVFLAHRTEAPRLAYLFPGQCSGDGDGGALRRRFPVAEHLFGMADEHADGDRRTQPLVIAGSMAGLRALHSLGIDADVAVGHGLGELTALSWGGAMDGGDLMRLATVRDQVIARAARTDGAMADVFAEQVTVEALASDRDVVIAGYHGRARTMISGPAADVAAVCADARSLGLAANRLDIAGACYSPLMRPAADALADRLTGFTFNKLRRPVVSTVTGERLTEDEDLRALLASQLVEPVRFHDAAADAVAGADLVVEVGPGQVLSVPVAEATPDALVLALDTDSTSLVPLLTVAGAAYALGVDVDPIGLFADRVIRPITEDTAPRATASHRAAVPHLAVERPSTRQDEVPGYAPWVRPFSVVHVPADRPSPVARTGSPGTWTLHAPPDHPLAEPLRAALVDAQVGDGVLLCLPASGATHADLFLRAGQEAAGAGPGTRFVVVQQDFGAAGLARTLHLERPAIHTTVVGLADATRSSADAVEAAVTRVVADVAATTGFTEVRYTDDGTRTIPVLRALPDQVEQRPDSPLGPDDVLLVTGTVKGVTAECALAMAQDSGTRLALLGRIDPATDREVSTNLARMVAAGVQVRYEHADVTDQAEVSKAVERIEAALGSVTAVLHGAGRNEPTALAKLTGEQLHRAIAPKVDGLRAVLHAVGADKITLLVTLDSIIGRTGQHGEAHYATANDWTSELTVDFGRRHPGTRALALEWAVRSGDGSTPMSLADGLAVLRKVLVDPAAGPVVVVSGRTGALPTVTLDQKTLPQNRFVDRVLLHYPGVELVTETELTNDDDPYLADHQLDGDALFPAALGMEAMTQVAAALSGATTVPLLENVELPHPIVVPPGGSTTVRLVALVTGADTVAVAIRSAETRFATDHVRALLRFPRPALPESPVRSATGPLVSVDPVADLYGGILFQGKRFQRLQSIVSLSARHVVAELTTTSSEPWFAAPLPQDLALADPGRRDAVLHAIQCCVPDVTLLPHGIERLYPADPAGPDHDVVVVAAREREQDGDRYVYDVDVSTTAGAPVERWEGLTLRATHRSDAEPWVPALLGPYLERAIEDVLGATGTVVVGSAPTGLTVTGTLPCAVDVVAEDALPDDQRSLSDRIAAETGETDPVAAARVRSALACPRGQDEPLTLDRVGPAGWVVLSDGEARIATWATTVDHGAEQVVFAVLSRNE
jgi:acyl transferase domain-containing protein